MFMLILKHQIPSILMIDKNKKMYFLDYVYAFIFLHI